MSAPQDLLFTLKVDNILITRVSYKLSFNTGRNFLWESVISECLSGPLTLGVKEPNPYMQSIVIVWVASGKYLRSPRGVTQRPLNNTRTSKMPFPLRKL